MVERKIFEEIRFCTYRDVEGFFEKYFKGKDWTRRALDVYEAMKDRHVDGIWTDLPNPYLILRRFLSMLGGNSIDAKV